MAKEYVFITGATAGFGKAIAKKFAEEGYNLVLTGRRNERLLALSVELTSKFPIEIQTLCFDVRNQKEVVEAVKSLPENVANNLNILVNNAGLAVGKGPIQDGLLDDWNRMLDTNVKGLLHVSQVVIPYLTAGSTIINIGSIAGKEVYPGGNVYCASKHAVDALTKAMRIDLVNRGIRVSQIAPGAAETEFSLVRFKGDESVAKSVYDGFEPLQAKDIADATFFVATRPNNVCINDLVIMPSAQANSTVFNKNN